MFVFTQRAPPVTPVVKPPNQSSTNRLPQQAHHATRIPDSLALNTSYSDAAQHNERRRRKCHQEVERALSADTPRAPPSAPEDKMPNQSSCKRHPTVMHYVTRYKNHFALERRRRRSHQKVERAWLADTQCTPPRTPVVKPPNQSSAHTPATTHCATRYKNPFTLERRRRRVHPEVERALSAYTKNAPPVTPVAKEPNQSPAGDTPAFMHYVTPISILVPCPKRKATQEEPPRARKSKIRMHATRTSKPPADKPPNKSPTQIPPHTPLCNPLNILMLLSM